MNATLPETSSAELAAEVRAATGKAWLTVAEASRALGCDRHALQEACRTGAIPCRDVNQSTDPKRRRFKVTPSALAAWEIGRTQTGAM